MFVDTVRARLLRVAAVLPAALLMLVATGGSSALAVGPGPGWAIVSLAEPAAFSSSHDAACENEPGSSELGQGPCDHYRLFAQNVGAGSSAGRSRSSICSRRT